WGPRKIRARLMELKPSRPLPASSTIGDLLDRHGSIVARRLRRRATPSAAPLNDGLSANGVWAMEFKGWFNTADGSRCEPFTLQDHASRYLLRCQASRPCFAEARGILEAAFREFGLP